jgi:DNA mismatch endonuclease, patch repair protein
MRDPARPYSCVVGSATESWASSDAVRASMRANRARDTQPELALRCAIHALGLRYRVSVRPLPAVRRTADLVFTRVKVAVFLDGCFWHGCPEHHRLAARNREYWAGKVSRNRERDREIGRLLGEAGWLVIRVWEHEDPQDAAVRIGQLIGIRRKSLGL